MSYWKATNGIIGDAPADIMGEAIDEIRAQYREDLGREPTILEICEVVGFVLGALDHLDFGAASSTGRN